MDFSKICVNENFVGKLFSLSETEIHINVLSCLRDNSKEWSISSSISINTSLYIVVGSLPKKIKGIIKSKYYSNRQEFIPIVITNATNKEKELCLKIRSTYLQGEEIEHCVEINNYCNSPDEKEALNEKIRMFNFFISLTSTKTYTAKDIWKALMAVKLDYYTNETSFSRKLKEFRRYGPQVFLHSSRGIPKPWKQKITHVHIAKILELYGQNLDTEQIHIELNKYCEEFNLMYISRSTIKNIIRQPKNKVVFGLERNGASYVKNNVISYLEKEKPKFKLQVVECDGSRLQLPYIKTDESKYKIGFLTLYVIMDVASNKVIGYWVDDFENKDMVFMAFYMMLSNVNYLPAYIRIDRSSAHQSNRFNNFLSRAKELGMGHRFCYEPREKGTVESFFHWFPEKICKKYPTYVGLGPLTKDWDKKPSPEKIKQIENCKNLPSRSELSFFIPELIDQWNQRRNSSNSKTPDDIHLELKIDSGKYIPEETIAKLTWCYKKRKCFTRNTIRLGSGENMRSYRLQNKEAIMNYFEEPLNIYYLNSEPEYIYVFNQYDEFIEKAIKKTKYLDDPVRISDPENNAMLSESRDNYNLMKEIKEEVKRNNSMILQKSKNQSPFSITTGYNPNKQVQSTVLDDFALKHMERDNGVRSKIKNKDIEYAHILDKNIVSTDVKRRYIHDKRNTIRDVE